MATDPKLLELIRAGIAIKGIPKKVLARRCKISRPYFSLMIHGDKEMPEEVKQRLFKELGIQNPLAEFRALVNGGVEIDNEAK